MKTKTMLIGIFSGLITGAVIGILFAPNKGKVTRRKLIKQSDEYTDAIKEKINDLVEVMNGKFENVKKDISEYTESIKGKINDMRKAKKATMN
ncbi:MAG: YtxH domain-containing protein [Bacteroidota bacterium]|nr:YtxH domain-containing protein [Bacteroidota bacterium]